ncbi:MAG: hypothetical protein AAF462_08145 [Thermodesulfobacteriota bacterium]
MRYLTLFVSFLALLIFSVPVNTFSQDTDLSPLGFPFGINKKQARNIIDSNGKRIVHDKEDSKDMRVIMMQGVIVELPIDTAGRDVLTELEFYDKKLLSSSLVFKSVDESEKVEIETEFDKYFTTTYGEPTERGSMLHFKTITWHAQDMLLVLHANEKDHSVKVQYKYKPGLAKRFEDDLDTKRGTVHKDPAKTMFLEGDYSKPTGYDEQYGTQ